MSRNRGNQGRRRARSPCYCDNSITTLNAAEDTIRQLQAAVDEEQRTVTTLRRERDEAQSSTRIWERDLLVLQGDHRRLQDLFSRLTGRFANLAIWIQVDYREFQVMRLPDRRP
jgi:FtsZ-binding cell division protein ZapB